MTQIPTEIREAYKRYGAHLADEAFLISPKLESSLNDVCVALTKTIQDALSAWGFSISFIACCAECATVGFGQRFFELAVHNAKSDNADQAPIRH